MEVKADMLVWQTFLTGFNVRSFFLSDDWYDSHQLQLYTDASGTLVLVLFLVSIGAMVHGLIAGVIALLHF